MPENALLLESQHVWHTPFYAVNFPEHDSIKAVLLKYIIEQESKDKSAGVTSGVAETVKHSLYESRLDFLEADIDEIALLKSFLEELVLMAASETNAMHWHDEDVPECKIVESWCHVTRNGGYHDAHSHPNCSWCGIYFLEPGESNLAERNGVNRFYDPRVNANHYLDAGTAWLNNEGFWDMEPIAGQVIVFPSYLKHAALPYFGEKERVVIAFNAKVDFHAN